MRNDRRTDALHRSFPLSSQTQGPLLFSALYSWTCEQKPHGLVNPYLTFVMLGVTSLVAAILPIWVSPATNVSKGSYVEKMKLEAMSV